MTFSVPAPADRRMPRLDSIAGLTQRALTHRQVELALFAIVGGWISSGRSGLIRTHAAAWSQHHAWHAELWTARLPRTPLLVDSDHPGSGDAAATERHVALASLLDPDATESDRIAVYAHGVLAALDDALEDHRSAIDPALDAPTARVLDLVLTDVRRDRATAGSIAESLGGPDEAALHMVRAQVTDLIT